MAHILFLRRVHRSGSSADSSTGYEVLLQHRSSYISAPNTWGFPGGKIEPAEKAISSNSSFEPSVRWAARRGAALRELCEECGGGDPESLALQVLIPQPCVETGSLKKGRIVTAVLPSGFRDFVQDERLSRGMQQGGTFYFIYLLDSILDPESFSPDGMKLLWRPRAKPRWRGEVCEEDPASTFGYTWVPLQRLWESPDEPVPRSKLPLTPWVKSFCGAYHENILLQATALSSYVDSRVRPELPHEVLSKGYGKGKLKGFLPKGDGKGKHVTDEELLGKIRTQLEYYFSDENLLRPDEFMLSLVGPDGMDPVPASRFLTSFRRVQQMTENARHVVQAAWSSPLLVVSDDSLHIRRLHPIPGSRADLLMKIQSQLEYYFSDDNLLQPDDFMLNLIGPDGLGFVEINRFLSFRRIQQLTEDPADISEAVRLSPDFKLSDDGTWVRRTGPLPGSRADLLAKIQSQMEYYFSDENLHRPDDFMMRLIGPDGTGRVEIDRFISSFNRIKKLSRNAADVTDAIRSSSELALSADGTCVYRKRPLPDPSK